MFEINTTIFNVVDRENEMRALAEAEADIQKSRFVSHERAMMWFRSWDTFDELPISRLMTEHDLPITRQSTPRIGRMIAWTYSALFVDVDMIRKYLKNFNIYAPRAVAAQIVEVIDSIAISPFRRGNRAPGPQLRTVSLTRPYVIQYKLFRSGVFILRVRHAAYRSR